MYYYVKFNIRQVKIQVYFKRNMAFQYKITDYQDFGGYFYLIFYLYYSILYFFCKKKRNITLLTYLY